MTATLEVEFVQGCNLGCSGRRDVLQGHPKNRKPAPPSKATFLASSLGYLHRDTPAPSRVVWQGGCSGANTPLVVVSTRLCATRREVPHAFASSLPLVLRFHSRNRRVSSPRWTCIGGGNEQSGDGLTRWSEGATPRPPWAPPPSLEPPGKSTETRTCLLPTALGGWVLESLNPGRDETSGL